MGGAGVGVQARLWLDWRNGKRGLFRSETLPDGWKPHPETAFC